MQLQYRIYAVVRSIKFLAKNRSKHHHIWKCDHVIVAIAEKLATNGKWHYHNYLHMHT